MKSNLSIPYLSNEKFEEQVPNFENRLLNPDTNQNTISEIMRLYPAQNIWWWLDLLKKHYWKITAIRDSRFYKNDWKSKIWNWTEFTYSDLASAVDNYSIHLLSLWVKKWDRIWMIAENSPESIIFNFACQSIWAIIVPWTEDTMSYWINQEEAMESAWVDFIWVAWISATTAMINSWNNFISNIVSGKKLIPLDPNSKNVFRDENIEYTETIIYPYAEQFKKLEITKNTVEVWDIATIMYCSWTWDWWKPKAVEITHGNILHQCFTVPGMANMQAWNVFLEILPQHHIYQYIVRYVALSTGSKLHVSTVESLTKSKWNLLKEVNPEYIAAVARIWIAIKGKIENELTKKEKSPELIQGFIWKLIKNALIENMVKVADQDISSQSNKELREIAIEYWKPIDSFRENVDNLNNQVFGWIQSWCRWTIAKKLLYKKIREWAWLWNLKTAINWWWALPATEAAFFKALWVNLIPWYWATENTAIASVPDMLWWDPAFASWEVLPWTTVKVKTNENWLPELVIAWPHVGRYTEPTLNNELIPWWSLYIQDIGNVIKDDRDRDLVVITGRSKNIIKTQSWITVMPEPFEDALRTSSFIDECIVVWSESQKNLWVLIIPNIVHLRDYCDKNNSHYRTDDDMLNGDNIKSMIMKEIKQLATWLWQNVTVQHFGFIPDWFSQHNWTLSRSNKPIRPNIMKHYSNQINNMFN